MNIYITRELLAEFGLELDAARVAVDVAFDIEHLVVGVGDGGDEGHNAESRDECNSLCHFLGFYSFASRSLFINIYLFILFVFFSCLCVVMGLCGRGFIGEKRERMKGGTIITEFD